MKALGGLGIYPCERRLPGGHRLRAGGGAGVDDGGKMVAGAVGGDADEDEGEGGGDRLSRSSSSVSTNVMGVTLGAKVTGRGPYMPGFAGVNMA